MEGSPMHRMTRFMVGISTALLIVGSSLDIARASEGPSSDRYFVVKTSDTRDGPATSRVRLEPGERAVLTPSTLLPRTGDREICVQQWVTTYYRDFWHLIWSVHEYASSCALGDKFTDVKWLRDRDVADPFWTWDGWVASNHNSGQLDDGTRWKSWYIKGTFSSFALGVTVRDEGWIKMVIRTDGTVSATASNAINWGACPC
jgi:hypothetical protein